MEEFVFNTVEEALEDLQKAEPQPHHIWSTMQEE